MFILGPISEELQEESSNLPSKSVLNHVLEPLTPQNCPELNGTPKLVFMMDPLQEDAVKVSVGNIKYLYIYRQRQVKKVVYI